MKGTVSYFDQALQDILEATADKPQAPDVRKANALSIERMVRQCYALLRQGLERKVKLEPNVYSKEQMERVLREFEGAIPDIQEAISIRVSDSISELVRQEIRRVLKDALSDLEEAMLAQASGEEKGKVAPAARAEAPQQPKERPSASKEKSKPEISTESEEIRPGKGDTPREEAEHRPTDTSTDDTDAPKEGDEVADDEIYEGHVKLGVYTHGSRKQMIRFLNQVGTHPQLRMRQMVGSYRDATLWLALRQPLRLKHVLYDMENVSNVRVCPPRGSGDTEHVLEVLLEDLPESPS
ncbi:MAG: hypothetical protein ACE5KI_03630 [Dehalococcoidia bacterium]